MNNGNICMDSIWLAKTVIVGGHNAGLRRLPPGVPTRLSAIQLVHCPSAATVSKAAVLAQRQLASKFWASAGKPGREVRSSSSPPSVVSPPPLLLPPNLFPLRNLLPNRLRNLLPNRLRNLLPLPSPPLPSPPLPSPPLLLFCLLLIVAWRRRRSAGGSSGPSPLLHRKALSRIAKQDPQGVGMSGFSIAICSSEN